jgi:hypothetical protein
LKYSSAVTNYQTKSLTYLPNFQSGGVGTFITVAHTARVAKASSGHIPLPFLISILKNWLQRYKRICETAKKYFLGGKSNGENFNL